MVRGGGEWLTDSVRQQYREVWDASRQIHTDASLGVEYYTKLRHVSVGVEADFQALLLPMTFGVHVYPTVKYTF